MNIKTFTQYHTINEAHFEDVYGQQFAEFHKKYTDLISSGKLKKADKYYVQFTNLKDNALDKSIHLSPDHSDPVGIYAYPLSYVLNHPADIWYGSTAKHLRVIRDKSTSKLVLNSIRGGAGLTKALNNIGIEQSNQKLLIKLAQKNYPNRFTGVNKFAKLFMTILQMDLTGDRIKYDDGSDDRIRVYSGKEQSDRLLNYYDAIEDRSMNLEDAVINDREPEQICFLTRKAWEVVEIVNIHRSHKKGDSLIIGQIDTRKLAAMVAAKMNDKLTGGFLKKTMNEYDRYWTVKGRRIELDYTMKSDYRDGLGIGKKNHRWATFSDHNELSGKVYTEYGVFYLDDDEEKRYSNIIADFEEEFNDSMSNTKDANWKPETKADYELKQKQKRDAEIEIYRVEQRKKKQVEYIQVLTVLKKWADLMNIPYTIPTHEKVIYDIGEGIESTLRKFVWRHETVEEVLAELDDRFDLFGDLEKHYLGNEQGYQQVMQAKEIMRQILIQHPFIAKEPHAAEFNFRNLNIKH